VLSPGVYHKVCITKCVSQSVNQATTYLVRDFHQENILLGRFCPSSIYVLCFNFVVSNLKGNRSTKS
jgi:aminoglycoside/choline kinase family phosphotransferase